MDSVYYVSRSLLGREGWPTVATEGGERIQTTKFPHEVIEQYAQKHASELRVGHVIIAHRERDHSNFVAKVDRIVSTPRLVFV